MPDPTKGVLTDMTDEAKKWSTPSPLSNTGTIKGNSMVFGPGHPIMPINPLDRPRVFAYRPGINLIMMPRYGYGLADFQTLRNLAAACWQVRLNIELIKREVRSLEYKIVPVDETDKTDYSGDIKKINCLLEEPDGNQMDFDSWVNAALEEVMVTDALTIYPNFAGNHLNSLDLIDGTTIRPVLDYRGKIAKPPAPGYIQQLYGVPSGSWTTKELIYRPMNASVNSPYGSSPIEYFLLIVNLALRRDTYHVGYFTEGNVPEALVGAPASWTQDQIDIWQKYWDALVAGDMTNQRRMHWIPVEGGRGQVPVYEFRKDNVDTTAQDEWLMKVACWAFGNSPQEFGLVSGGGGLGGSGYADAMENVHYRSMIGPVTQYLSNIFTRIIHRNLMMPHLKYQWVGLDPAEDDLKNAQVDQIYLPLGAYDLAYVQDRLGIPQEHRPPEPPPQPEQPMPGEEEPVDEGGQDDGENDQLGPAQSDAEAITKGFLARGLITKAAGKLTRDQIEREFRDAIQQYFGELRRRLVSQYTTAKPETTLFKEADFDESKHPRADDGKFAHTAGSGSGKKDDDKEKKAPAEDPRKMKPGETVEEFKRRRKKERRLERKGRSAAPAKDDDVKKKPAGGGKMALADGIRTKFDEMDDDDKKDFLETFGYDSEDDFDVKGLPTEDLIPIASYLGLDEEDFVGPAASLDEALKRSYEHLSGDGKEAFWEKLGRDPDSDFDPTDYSSDKDKAMLADLLAVDGEKYGLKAPAKVEVTPDDLRAAFDALSPSEKREATDTYGPIDKITGDKRLVTEDTLDYLKHLKGSHAAMAAAGHASMFADDAFKSKIEAYAKLTSEEKDDLLHELKVDSPADLGSVSDKAFADAIEGIEAHRSYGDADVLKDMKLMTPHALIELGKKYGVKISDLPDLTGTDMYHLKEDMAYIKKHGGIPSIDKETVVHELIALPLETRYAIARDYGADTPGELIGSITPGDDLELGKLRDRISDEASGLGISTGSRMGTVPPPVGPVRGSGETAEEYSKRRRKERAAARRAAKKTPVSATTDTSTTSPFGRSSAPASAHTPVYSSREEMLSDAGESVLDSKKMHAHGSDRAIAMDEKTGRSLEGIHGTDWTESPKLMAAVRDPSASVALVQTRRSPAVTMNDLRTMGSRTPGLAVNHIVTPDGESITLTPSSDRTAIYGHATITRLSTGTEHSTRDKTFPELSTYFWDSVPGLSSSDRNFLEGHAMAEEYEAAGALKYEHNFSPEHEKLIVDHADQIKVARDSMRTGKRITAEFAGVTGTSRPAPTSPPITFATPTGPTAAAPLYGPTRGPDETAEAYSKRRRKERRDIRAGKPAPTVAPSVGRTEGVFAGRTVKVSPVRAGVIEAKKPLFTPPTSSVKTAVESAHGALKYHSRASRDPHADEKVVANLKEAIDRSPLSMRISASSLAKVLADPELRFKTQFETHTSHGSLSPEFRSRAEAKGLGVPSDVKPALRPVYGYVNVDEDMSSMAHYGEIEMQYHDSVRDRTTFTVGDSLGDFASGAMIGAPLSAPHLGACDGQAGAAYDKNWDSVSYVEAQIHGGVTIPEVKRVVFHRECFDRTGLLKPEYARHEATFKSMGIETAYDNGRR